MFPTFVHGVRQNGVSKKPDISIDRICVFKKTAPNARNTLLGPIEYKIYPHLSRKDRNYKWCHDRRSVIEKCKKSGKPAKFSYTPIDYLGCEQRACL
jgi:hypothetical protein